MSGGAVVAAYHVRDAALMRRQGQGQGDGGGQ